MQTRLVASNTSRDRYRREVNDVSDNRIYQKHQSERGDTDFSALYSIATAMRLLVIVMNLGVGVAYWVFAVPFAKFVCRGLWELSCEGSVLPQVNGLTICP